MKFRYKKVPNNENAIEVDGKVVLSFDPKYKEYLKWKDENPELEQELLNEIGQEIENKRLYNLGAPHKKDNVWKWYNVDGQLILESKVSTDKENDDKVRQYELLEKPDDFVWEVEKTSGKYIRVSAKNVGKLPEQHPAAGSNAWIFIDEIIIN